MSSGTQCTCGVGVRYPRDQFWRVSMRGFNRSAFNGYRVTPSPYSEVHCTSCGAVWRTKAAYVATPPDAPLHHSLPTTTAT